MNLLVTFYEGTRPDHRGRSLSEILQWDADELEGCHDYIQMLFPLPEISDFNWNAPIIDREVWKEFRSRLDLRLKLRESFEKILWFYGFVLQTEGGIEVLKGPNYSNHCRNWDMRFNHNHLRITRIIRSLRVLGLEDEALAFWAALEAFTVRASSRSREYWRRAAKRSLNLRPDLEDSDISGDDDLTVGPKFLREFEASRKVRS